MLESKVDVEIKEVRKKGGSGSRVRTSFGWTKGTTTFKRVENLVM